MTEHIEPTETQEMKPRARRKFENRATAGILALLFGYTTREMVIQNDAMTAALGAALTVALIWYAVGGLRTA